MRNRAWRKMTMTALAGALGASASAHGALTDDLVGYYSFDGSLANTAAAVGGAGGAADASYAGNSTLRFLVGDAVSGVTSFFPDGFAGLTGDAVYLGGDTAALDHLTIPGLTLGSSSFTVSVWAAMGEDQSAGNSGNESLGGNGPAVFSNKPVRFNDRDGAGVDGGDEQGFAYGAWASAGDDYGANASDGAGNTGTTGGTDVSFDVYVQLALVYDAAAQEVRRYQAGALLSTIDVSGWGSLDSGNDLRIGGYPLGSTSGSDTFWGSIDDVGIWDRALTGGEIAQVNLYGSFGFDLEDAINGVALPVAGFTGNDPDDNLASNDDNWSQGPSSWGAGTQVNVAAGTTATFEGANTGPAVFDSSFGSQSVQTLNLGGSGITTFMEMTGDAEIIGLGNGEGINTNIGVSGSTVHLTMSGNARIEHHDSTEEGGEVAISVGGANANVTMNDSSEIVSGPRLADARFATGFRRPVTSDGIDRFGDDVQIGRGGNLNLTMNGDSIIFSPDVVGVNTSTVAEVTVTQNDNSQVIANWDTRWFDQSGQTASASIEWYLNDNSRFAVGRDHGLGQGATGGSIYVEVNDNAEFFAGDRLVLIGAGTQNHIVVNGGLVKVGGNSPDDVLLVDDTGQPGGGDPGNSPVVRDWILHMGGGSTSVIDVNGGAVEVGRDAFIGRGGGNATLNVAGGTFSVLGVGPTGAGQGNGPGGGVPTNIQWNDVGGDVFVGVGAGDTGALNQSGGVVDIARDLVVGLGGDGTLSLTGPAAAAEASNHLSSFTLGGDLGFGGDQFGTEGGQATFSITIGSGGIVPIVLDGSNSGSTGSVFIYDGSIFQPGLASGYTPTEGQQWTLIEFAGDRLSDAEADPGTGEFDIQYTYVNADFSLIYDDANGRIILEAFNVIPAFVKGDMNGDGVLDAFDVAPFELALADIDAYMAAFPGLDGVARGDINMDGGLDAFDVSPFEVALASSGGAVPEPASLMLLGIGGLALARRRRA